MREVTFATKAMRIEWFGLTSRLRHPFVLCMWTLLYWLDIKQQFLFPVIGNRESLLVRPKRKAPSQSVARRHHSTPLSNVRFVETSLYSVAESSDLWWHCTYDLSCFSCKPSLTRRSPTRPYRTFQNTIVWQAFGVHVHRLYAQNDRPTGIINFEKTAVSVAAVAAPPTHTFCNPRKAEYRYPNRLPAINH